MRKNVSCTFICIMMLLSFISCGSEEYKNTAPSVENGVIQKEDLNFVAPIISDRKSDILTKGMTAEEKELAKNLMSQKALRSTSTNAPSGSVRTPAEYEQMEGVLVRVPNDSDLDEFFGNMIRGIVEAGTTPYLVYTTSTDKNNIIQFTLNAYGVTEDQVVWIQQGVDAFWSRDYGPWHIYVDGERAIVDMKYYPTRPKDDYIPIKLGQLWGDDVYKAHLYVEGGNFMTDGKGTCWTSSGVFDRNNLSATQVRNLYKNYLGCQKTYFPEPLYNEGTTHIDMYSKILNNNTILVGYSKSSWGATSKEIASLEAAEEFYRNSTNVNGQPYNIVRIPMTFGGSSDRRVYYSYTNSTILNNTVLVPQYAIDNFDSYALDVYREAMPGYSVKGVAGAGEVIPFGGSVHCTTMQIPKDFGVKAVCGNDIVESGEKCDGNTASCSSLNSIYTGGTAYCNSSCNGWDTNSCIKEEEEEESDLVTATESGTVKKEKWQLYGYYEAGEGKFKVKMTGTGDADLFVWKNIDGNSLTYKNYSCRPYKDGSAEECEISGPGRFVVGVNGYASSSKYDLTITFFE